MPLQPERGLRDLLGDGLVLHSDGRHAVRVLAHLVRGGQAARSYARNRNAQGTANNNKRILSMIRLKLNVIPDKLIWLRA